MQSLSAAAMRTSGNSASRSSTGTVSSTFRANLGLEHLESREPILFTTPRVALISSVRAATNASRARNTTRSLPYLSTAVLHRVQRLRIHSPQPGQLVGIDPIILSLAPF